MRSLSLPFESILISVGMFILCLIPFFFKGAKTKSRLPFLLGTGALVGICIFDLVPDVFEMGGSRSLLLAGIIWVVYSLIHLFHTHHHGHSEESNLSHSKFNMGFFLGSMMAHCIASGMLLVLSFNLSRGLAYTVFFALLAHKGYEALTVSSILIDKEKSPFKLFGLIALYALSFPTGVLLTILFRSQVTQSVALFGTSLALGTLLGCLIFDFILPSLTHVKRQKRDLAWIVAGLISTQFIMWAV